MNDADKTKRIIAMMTDEKPAKFFIKPGCLNCESAVCGECNATAAKDAEIEALRAEVERLRGLVVSRFDQDGPPTFRQGTPENELEDPVTAEHCAWFVAEIKRLRAEVERLQEQLRLATVDQAIAEAEASDAHAENKRLQEAFVAQRPAAVVGEEIMVNAAHGVFTLPLQPSGLSSGPRFVVHVPAPEQPAADPGACPACNRAWSEHRIGYSASACKMKQPAAVDEAMVDALRDPADEEGRAITAVQVTLFGRACYLPADIAQEVEQACAAREQEQSHEGK